MNLYLIKNLFLAVTCLCTISNRLSAQVSPSVVNEHEMTLYDTERDRLIPLATYAPLFPTQPKGIVIMNHGYDRNKGGSYKTYSYLTRTLANNGYFVISIQHELPDDDLLAMEGDLYQNRLPNWERGVNNINFTIRELKEKYMSLNWSDLIMIGHSNGGDMAMLFASKHPDIISKAISLDNRRMPLPRTSQPQILSLRGNDYEADPGVLPNAEEQQTYGIKILTLDDIGHSDMDDKGQDWQLEKICQHILEFLP